MTKNNKRMKTNKRKLEEQPEQLGTPVASNCDFRIKEFRGLFDIQKRVVETKGMWC